MATRMVSFVAQGAALGSLVWLATSDAGLQWLQNPLALLGLSLIGIGLCVESRRTPKTADVTID